MFNYITPVMYTDSTGEFAISLGIALIAAFVVGSVTSAISQGLQYGWDEISVLQVFMDGALAAVSIGIAATGIGLIGSTLVGAGLGIGQYVASCGLHNEAITVQGLIISGVVGGIAGAISGAGARNTRLINGRLNSAGVGGKGVKALTTAANRYASGDISKRGFMGVFNLYGKGVFNSIQRETIKIVSSAFTKSSIIIFSATVLTPGATYLGNHLDFDYS